MVGATGIEPVTPTMSTSESPVLYVHIIVFIEFKDLVRLYKKYVQYLHYRCLHTYARVWAKSTRNSNNGHILTSYYAFLSNMLEHLPCRCEIWKSQCLSNGKTILDTPAPDFSKSWYVVQCLARRERYAQQNLNLQYFQTFYPFYFKTVRPNVSTNCVYFFLSNMLVRPLCRCEI